MNRFIYLFAVIIVGTIRRLPLLLCFRLGQCGGLLAWLLLPRYRTLATRNLQIALGTQKSPQELRRLARKSFLLLGANLFCSLKIPALSEQKLAAIFTIEGEEHWKKHITEQKDKGTVVALSHFGNWELNAHIARFVTTRRSGAVYQPLRNHLIDDLINRDRRSRGVATFDRKRDLPAAANMLREGGIVGVLIDQHAGDAGQWIPFFNKLASTSPLAATLAQKTGSSLISVTIHTVAPARWVVRVHPEIPTEKREVGAITFDLGAVLAREIGRSPADWFWVHNRWKLPKPSFLLTKTKRGYYLPPSLSCAPSLPDLTSPEKTTKIEERALQPLKLLVRSPNWLGDACMAAPAIRSLKLGRPDLKLTILTPAKLADVWKALPEVDNIIVIPAKASPWKVARLLRAQATSSLCPPFDAALLIPNSIRSALEVWIAGIPRRIGRTGKKGGMRKCFINQPFPQEIESASYVHEADQYLAIAQWLGAPAPPPALSLSPNTKEDALRARKIALVPGAEYGPAKRWPADRFRQVMEQLSLAHDIHWIILGTAAERPLATSIAEGFPGSVENKAGETSLAELLEVLQDRDLVITNDTGTMHLADLLGVPTVAIFGSTDPTRTGPQNPHHRILRHPVFCSPCFLRECPIDFRCMNGITADMVVQAVQEELFFSKN